MFPQEPVVDFLGGNDTLPQQPVLVLHGIEPSTDIGGTVFPEEIMIDILSRVPSEPLMRFKLVNRAWEMLMRDNYFISSVHLPQMKKLNLTGYMLQAQYDMYPLGYKPGLLNSTYNNRMREQHEPEVYLLASCNGLVLQSNSADEFHLLNPSTGVMALIPHSLIVFPAECTFASVVFGMGYDDANDVFKILRVCCFNNMAKDTSVSVLTTSTMEWSDLGAFPYPCPVGHPGVFVGGCINWQAEVGNRTECIASFNCRTNQFGRIDLPPRVESVHYYGELGALDDDHLVFYSSVCITFAGFEMWVLGQYGASDTWIRVRFPIGGVINLEERALGIHPIRAMKPDDTSILFRVDPLDQYFVYHLDRRTFEQLDAPVISEDYCTVFPFVQSLVDPRFLMQ